MKIRIDKTLKFWVEVELERVKSSHPNTSSKALRSSILVEFEAAGDAMRTVNSNGAIAWKATPKMLEKLAEAELE